MTSHWSPLKRETSANQGFLLGPRELFQGILVAERLADRPEAPLVDQRHRTPASCVLRPTPRIVGRNARLHLGGVARVERAVGAAEDIDVVQGVRIVRMLSEDRAPELGL